MCLMEELGRGGKIDTGVGVLYCTIVCFDGVVKLQSLR